MRILATAVAAAVLAASPGAGDRPPPGPLLRIVHELDDSGGYPIEGARSFLRVRGEGLLGYDAEFSHQDFEVEYPVRGARRVTVTSFQRVCGGHCGNLEPPSAECRRTISLPERGVVTVRIRVRFGSRGCSMTVG